MSLKSGFVHILFIAGFLFLSVFSPAQRIMEKLNRGMVAVVSGTNGVFISWRLLATDPQNISFNVYRNQTKINSELIINTTSFLDEKGAANDLYRVVKVIEGKEINHSNEKVIANAKPYLDIPLKTPEAYKPNDASVGDLDGDGEYEIILHQVGRGRDNSHKGETTEPIFQAYKMDGTFLWEINLGKNIRDGAHYTQFMVYDLDCDGKAEFACKTADGTIDGQGKVIGDAIANYVNEDGKILDGPEFFTIFDGLTGKELATTDYIPNRYPLDGWGGVGGNGGNDSSVNRVDRFLAGVAYLDGIHPSVIMCRGYYGRSVLAAWDWKNGELKSRWVFDSAESGLEKFSGMGNHSLSIADVDNDGKDEIIYGAMTVDDDGSGLYSTHLRHGDALHVSDLDPTRPGLEVWGIHENEAPIEGYGNGFGAALFDAGTGEIIWGKLPGKDVGRGVAADIDSAHFGAEMWCSGSGGLWNNKGEIIGETPNSSNFAIWWDGDLLRELLDRNKISKYKGEVLLNAEEFRSNNGSKATPTLSADLFGDWREEVIFAAEDNQSLRIYTTTIPTKYRFVTLMHDPHYRLSIAWQNVAYNQPPHTSFYLGHGMDYPVNPNKFIQFK
ncbi:MAG: rhamnogalacturonan lyase [Prolixibacteraceae bacterium]|jgi:rhamnogalacturonan endolyase|nr:rhamnogalacturonan lyase [Prolixibacteraceae bacterium]MBT6767158.1 rhamnogalacturonan lyase [Prolixibacteraceae bacterium]MBT6997653.1 rhamnogalacturonan lyase [Prolixibacteraceae bacterium]MBT7394651.1 rhamnogalacturonan lyase [Prolixibacteraceae bacterium]